MKKLLLLPFLATMALVSWGWSADYTPCTSVLGNDYYCDWEPGCYQINKGLNDAENCQTNYDNCKKNGYLYLNVTNAPNSTEKCNGTWAKDGKDPGFNGGVRIWCKWATGCQPIKDSATLDTCINVGSVFKGVPTTGIGEGKTCAGGTWTEQGKNPNATQLGCCKWSTGTTCYSITLESEALSCKTGSNTFWSGSTITCNPCPDTTPTYSPSSSSKGSSSSSSTAGGASSSSSSSGGTGGSSSSGDSGDSSSSEDTSPITSRSTLVASQSPATYYSLKGEPLGNAKPQKAGVYIVKQQGSPIKKIVIR